MSIPTKIRSRLHDRAGGRCEICGLYGANNAHHRRNKSQGGQDVLSNLMLLCGSGTTGCHGFVTEHPTDAVVEGWTIQGVVAVPARTEVRVRGVKGLLDDAGGFTRVPAPQEAG